MKKTIITSESVCSGHPDKICDQVSDSILDAALSGDKYARVAVETLVTKNFVCLAGELTTKKTLDYEKIARATIKKLGYNDKKLGFWHNSPMTIKIHTQSPEIAAGVDKQGAGDQGMMYGYACNECESYMPLPIIIAHELAEKIDMMREKKTLPYLLPDGKSQVSVVYENDTPVSVDKLVLAAPHLKKITNDEVKHDLYRSVVVPVLKKYGFTIAADDVILNGTGVWNLPGPAADTGVTGRKIVVDTYGGVGRVGGGAFSGKDPTKVDRSGAYAARYLAKNIVAAGLASRCEVRLAYYIGAIRPVMQQADTFGTAKKSEKVINDYMQKLLDTSVEGIIEAFDLRRPIYTKTAAYGHFGRKEFPWEKIVV